MQETLWEEYKRKGDSSIKREGQLLLPSAQKTQGTLSLTLVNNLQETLASAAVGLHALQVGKTLLKENETGAWYKLKLEDCFYLFC